MESEIDWVERGFIFSTDNNNDFSYSHAHKPTPLLVDDNTLRIYFGVRAKDGRTRTTFIDVNPDNPLEIIRDDLPLVLDLGKVGAFDDCGANVCSLVDRGDHILMYFIGWNPGTTVHTRNAIGVAISWDRGETFTRLYDGAVVDRNKDEPYYTGAVDVIYNNDKFEMWYTSGVKWEIVNHKPEIIYHIKHAISEDGFNWNRNPGFCIPSSIHGEVTARPGVLIENGLYKMWFSHRNINGFRNKHLSMYRSGYAESKDGISWCRDDSMSGITPGEKGDWDDQAIAYPYVRKIKGKYIMFYNGNGFGKSGFGYMLGYKNVEASYV